MQVGSVKFIVTKFTGLDGRVVVAFTEDRAGVDAFTIKINPEGMWFTGTSEMKITTEAELQDFAKMISNIWSEQRKLRPKLTTSLAGH